MSNLLRPPETLKWLAKGWLSLVQILQIELYLAPLYWLAFYICRSSNFLFIDLKDKYIWLEFCLWKFLLFIKPTAVNMFYVLVRQMLQILEDEYTVSYGFKVDSLRWSSRIYHVYCLDLLKGTCKEQFLKLSFDTCQLFLILLPSQIIPLPLIVLEGLNRGLAVLFFVMTLGIHKSSNKLQYT